MKFKLYLMVLLSVVACQHPVKEMDHTDFTLAQAPLHAMRLMNIVESDPRFIRSGVLELEVDSVDKTYDSVKSLLPALHAYVSQENQLDEDQSLKKHLEIRVEE